MTPQPAADLGADAPLDAVPAPRARAAKFAAPALVFGALSLALVVGVYWFIATRPGVNPALVPTPPRVAAELFAQIASGDLLVNAWASLQRVLIGFAIGAALAAL